MAIGMRRSTLFGGHNIEIFDGKCWKNIEDYKYELEGNNGKVLLDKTKKKV